MKKLKDKYLTSRQVADELGFSPDHIRKLIANGKLRAEKVGHNWLVKLKDLKFIKRQRFSRVNGVENGRGN